MSELENGFRIGDAIAMVRRRLPIVLGACVLGLIAGYLVFASAPEIFSATSRVEVKPIQLDQFDGESRSEEVDIETEKEKVKSDAVADAVRAELGLEGENRAILARIVVANDIDSRILRISFDGDTAKQARDGANAAARGYLDERMTDASATAQTALERIEQELASLATERAEVQQALDDAPSGSAERAQLQGQIQRLNSEEAALTDQQAQLNGFDPATVGRITREASLPAPTTSKMALGKAVGVFGLFVLAGLALAWLLDRRDGMGGGRRRVEQLVPGANVRILPGADGRSASPAEVDAAIDRLAVELVAGGSPGKPASVVVVGTGMEPPVALAEELASSLAFAGIPALFVLAGSSDREVRSARSVPSFADLVTGQTPLSGPAGLPAQSGESTRTAAPLITWLRPTGSAEAAGLLRRTVVDTLVTRAGRERFEAVVFVAPSPSRAAAGTALGQWVGRSALIVEPGAGPQAEAAATALAEAGVRVTEVVWT